MKPWIAPEVTTWMTEDWLGQAAYKAIITTVAIVLVVLAHRLTCRYLARRVANPDLRTQYWELSKNLYIFLGILVVAVVWLHELKTVSLLLTGLVAAFMVTNKEVFLGFAGRVYLASSGAYHIGDRIWINKTGGDVINIGLFSTWLQQVGGEHGENQSTGKIAIIPHLWLVQHDVVNFTKSNDYNWDEIAIPFPLDIPRRAVMELLQKEAAYFLRDEIVHATLAIPAITRFSAARMPPVTPVCYAGLERYNNGTRRLVLTVRFTVRARMRRHLHSGLLIHLLDALEAANVKYLSDPPPGILLPPESKKTEKPKRPRKS
ncbi:MAG: mechanosensitive ion channel family protein [Deltaproteobacteria bacterium]|nr:mechanosensitive ion channel family protein [Deltaproteobacteria bacterium]